MCFPAMKRMASSNVLIVGVQGLGVEIGMSIYIRCGVAVRLTRAF